MPVFIISRHWKLRELYPKVAVSVRLAQQHVTLVESSRLVQREGQCTPISRSPAMRRKGLTVRTLPSAHPSASPPWNAASTLVHLDLDPLQLRNKPLHENSSASPTSSALDPCDRTQTTLRQRQRRCGQERPVGTACCVRPAGADGMASSSVEACLVLHHSAALVVGHHSSGRTLGLETPAFVWSVVHIFSSR